MKLSQMISAAALGLAVFSGCQTVVYEPAPTVPGPGTGGGCTSGCGGGGNPYPAPAPAPAPDPYYNAWYDVYGNYCSNSSPMPGCNFYSDGTKIQDYEDPYYYNKYLQYSSQWTYTDSYGYQQAYTGWAWLSNTGILYDEYGNALNEIDDSDSRDLLGQAADLEAAAVDASGKTLAGKFALADDRAIEIARTLNDWAVLGKSRSRTGKDVADFSQKLYGVNLDSAKSALAEAAQGKLDDLTAVNKQVAAYWGTNPETSQAILSTWYAGQYKAQ
jgi:hypothetical protein